MSVSLLKFYSMLLVTSCFLLLGCQQKDRDELGIHFKKRTYEKWLVQQRPFLGSLPKSAIVDYDFTTLEDGTNVSPVVTYNLKAGNWDGVVELWFTLKLDAKRQPIGMSEETVTFIELPAKKTVIDKEGRQRNQYYGIKIRKPPEIAAIIKRVAAGGDFGDYRKKVEESGEFACSFLDYNDPWKSHGTK
jgi:hypothetical protein